MFKLKVQNIGKILTVRIQTALKYELFKLVACMWKVEDGRVHILRVNIEQLDRENRLLKRSLYELATQHNLVSQELLRQVPTSGPLLRQLCQLDSSRFLQYAHHTHRSHATIADTAQDHRSASPVEHAMSHHGSRRNSVFPVHSTNNVMEDAALNGSVFVALHARPVSPQPVDLKNFVPMPEPSPSGSPPSSARSLYSAQVPATIVNAFTSAALQTASNGAPACLAADIKLLSTSASSNNISLSGPGLTRVRTENGGEREQRGTANMSNNVGGQSKTVKVLHFKQDLLAHTAATYAVVFAPSGQLLASASFDRSIRVWDMYNLDAGGTELGGGVISDIDNGQQHQGAVRALAWHADSKRIVSGGQDETVRCWDVEHRRQPQESVRELSNPSAITTSYVFRQGEYLLTGDQEGVLKTWETGSGRVVHEFDTDPEHRVAIAHLAVCEPHESEEEGRLLAVNCWDSTLRVYDRGKRARAYQQSHPSLASHLTHSAQPTPGGSMSSGVPLPYSQPVLQFPFSSRHPASTLSTSLGLSCSPLLSNLIDSPPLSTQRVYSGNTRSTAASYITPYLQPVVSTSISSQTLPPSSAPRSIHSSPGLHHNSFESPSIVSANGHSRVQSVSLNVFPAALHVSHPSVTAPRVLNSGVLPEIGGMTSCMSTNSLPVPQGFSHTPLVTQPVSAFALSLLHECRSHRNTTWPIQSAFYVGREYQGLGTWRPVTAGSMDERERLERDLPSTPSMDPAGLGQGSAANRASAANVTQTVLLASGSADNAVYLYDVGGYTGSAKLVQRLEGHKDRVYSTSFHPHDPILASASADGVIKLWATKNAFFGNI